MGPSIRSSPSGVLQRVVRTGLALSVVLHTGSLLTLLALRELGRADLWFVDGLLYPLPWLFVPLIVLLPTAVLLRSRFLSVLTSVPAALFLLIYGQVLLPDAPEATPELSFSVMTYNVLYSNPHADEIAAVIEAHAPGVVGLHELEQPMASLLEARLQTHYPHRRIESGRGLFSRYPIREYAAFRLGQGEGHWAQDSVLDIDGVLVRVVNVHPRAPELTVSQLLAVPVPILTRYSARGRDEDLLDLASRVGRIEGPLVVMGDFNLSDQHPQYAALTRNLRDAHRERGWGMGFTFTPLPRIGLSTWRIDYVLHSPDLVTLGVEVGEYGGSDHRPVVARLGLPARAR